MARTIAPDRPTAIEPVQMEIPGIDLTLFDKIGDYKIKSATQNFQLYATTTANAEAQKLYQKYKNNPIALANALQKLPDMLKDLPQSIQDQMKPKMDTNAISLVTRAQANQEKAIAKQNKALAHANATLGMSQLSGDFFNVLRYITADEADKRPIDLAIYRQHRAELEKLAAATDENGNPLFSESIRNKLLMPKDSSVAGFKQFINRFELDDLKAWDEKFFQDQDTFMAITGIDADTYEAMGTAMKNRLKALADTKTRTLHGQAYYDATNLISEPTQLNIERVKATGVIPEKTINKIVEASKSATEGKYAYDPDRMTSPGAFIEQLANFTETVNSTDWSPQGRNEAIGQAADSLWYLSRLAKQTNMSPELVDKTVQIIQTALLDKVAAETLDTTLPQIKNNIYGADGHINLAQLGVDLNTKDSADNVRKLAKQNYEANVLSAMDSFIRKDMDGYNQKLANADLQYKMDSLAYMHFTPAQWKKWQQDVENGKDVVIEYQGNAYKFNGFNAQNPLTLINLI